MKPSRQPNLPETARFLKSGNPSTRSDHAPPRRERPATDQVESAPQGWTDLDLPLGEPTPALLLGHDEHIATYEDIDRRTREHAAEGGLDNADD